MRKPQEGKMTLIQSILLGLVQGITEFLPVSSSGHLILFQNILNIDIGTHDIFFDTMLHFGTLIAVFFAFRKKICALISTFFKSIPQLFKGKLHAKTASGNQRMIFFIIVSILPLFVLVPFKDKIETAYSSTLLVGIALLVTSIFLFASDHIVTGKKDAEKMTLKDSIVVGIVQAIALVPGISRSGSTITAGLACGFNRKFAAEYSFILSIPTILGSVVLNIFDIVQEGSFNISLLPVFLVGTAVAAISGFAAIKLLEYILKSKKFTVFSVYCFAVGVFAIIFSLVK